VRHRGRLGLWARLSPAARVRWRDGLEINVRWTALRRRSAHKPGKTDQIEAHAIALLVRQESAELPASCPTMTPAVLELLTVQRESAQAEATRLRNQIHALLLQLDPEYRTDLPRGELEGRTRSPNELRPRWQPAPARASLAILI
jgi:Transposase